MRRGQEGRGEERTGEERRPSTQPQESDSEKGLNMKRDERDAGVGLLPLHLKMLLNPKLSRSEQKCLDL